jgi:tetratricopeptide (TPR) repeat protein
MKGIESFLRAAEAYPYLSEAWNNLALLASNLGANDAAIAYSERALIVGMKPSSYAQLATFIAQDPNSSHERVRLALKLLMHAIKHEPNARAYFNAVILATRSNQLEEAFNIAKNGVGAFPNDWHLLYGAALAARPMREFETALSYLKRAIAIEPKNDDLYLALGDFYRVDIGTCSFCARSHIHKAILAKHCKATLPLKQSIPSLQLSITISARFI